MENDKVSSGVIGDLLSRTPSSGDKDQSVIDSLFGVKLREAFGGEAAAIVVGVLRYGPLNRADRLTMIRGVGQDKLTMSGSHHSGYYVKTPSVTLGIKLSFLDALSLFDNPGPRLQFLKDNPPKPRVKKAKK
jgi:hypothetical protein